MALTKEQINELKDQLRDQVENLPEGQKSQALEQIDSMSDESIEAMLKQQQSAPKDIFRQVISGNIPSKKIDENKDAVAVLDIKPISKGHSIIIPKIHVKNTKKLPNSVFSLAKKITNRIIKKLEAKGTEIQTEFKFGEIIVNVIPIYDKPLSLNSPRSEMPENELEDIYKKLKFVKKPKTIKVKKEKESSSKVIKLKRRVP